MKFSPLVSPTGRLIRSSPELQEFKFGKARVVANPIVVADLTDLTDLERRISSQLSEDMERTYFDWEQVDRYGDQDD